MEDIIYKCTWKLCFHVARTRGFIVSTSWSGQNFLGAKMSGTNAPPLPLADPLLLSLTGSKTTTSFHGTNTFNLKCKSTAYFNESQFPFSLTIIFYELYFALISPYLSGGYGFLPNCSITGPPPFTIRSNQPSSLVMVNPSFGRVVETLTPISPMPLWVTTCPLTTAARLK